MMDLTNVLTMHFSSVESLDTLERQEILVTANRSLGHAVGLEKNIFSNFIIMDSDDESNDDTEEEFPIDDTLMVPQNMHMSSPFEFDMAPQGHNNKVLNTFSNICFVLEDEAPIKSCIRRVQDLDVSDYTEEECLNLDDSEIEPDLVVE